MRNPDASELSAVHLECCQQLIKSGSTMIDEPEFVVVQDREMIYVFATDDMLTYTDINYVDAHANLIGYVHESVLRTA